MKAFFISCVIFAIMLISITFNYFYVNNSANRLEYLTEKIETGLTDAQPQLISLENFWNENKSFLELTISHGTLNNIEIRIKAIRYCFDIKDDVLLLRELFHFKEEINELRRTDRICAENIF